MYNLIAILLSTLTLFPLAIAAPLNPTESAHLRITILNEDSHKQLRHTSSREPPVAKDSVPGPFLTPSDNCLDDVLITAFFPTTTPIPCPNTTPQYTSDGLFAKNAIPAATSSSAGVDFRKDIATPTVQGLGGSFGYPGSTFTNPTGEPIIVNENGPMGGLIAPATCPTTSFPSECYQYDSDWPDVDEWMSWACLTSTSRADMVESSLDSPDEADHVIAAIESVAKSAHIDP